MESNERAEKFKNWLKNPYNLALLGIILFSLIIRIYYFYATNGQTLWWDEAEYMSTAKKWAFGVPYDLNSQRPPLFQFLAAIVYMVGLGENFIKFVFVLLPSVFLVLSIYLLGKEMFDKKIGLIAALLASVSWTFLFWGGRMQPDFLTMTFQVLSIYFMWKYWKKPETKNAVLSGFFVALAFYFKVSALLVPMIFIVFIILKDRFSALKEKGYYWFSASFLATLIPYFIWSQKTFGTPFGFRTGYTPDALHFPIGWYNFRFYSFLTDGPSNGELIGSSHIGILFVLFLIGVVIALKFLLYLDILIKDKKRVFDPEIFSIIALAFISAFYIFYIRNTDDRWVFLWMPFIFFLIGSAVMWIYDRLAKHGKQLATGVIIILIALCIYSQVVHASGLVENKRESYSPVREAGLWIKDNSNPEDKVMSISYTQSTYYTERNVSTYSLIKNENEFSEYLRNNKPRYIQASLFEPHPAWMLKSGMQEGYSFIVLTYFNSTVVTKDGKLVSLDIKQQINRDGMTFQLAYPRDQLNGVFVYEASY